MVSGVAPDGSQAGVLRQGVRASVDKIDPHFVFQVAVLPFGLFL